MLDEHLNVGLYLMEYILSSIRNFNDSPFRAGKPPYGGFAVVANSEGRVLIARMVGSPNPTTSVSNERNAYEKINRMAMNGAISSSVGKDDELERFEGGVRNKEGDILAALDGEQGYKAEFIVATAMFANGMADQEHMAELMRTSQNALLIGWLQNR